jgi:Sec-independent protein translocase protein TatA
MVDVLFILALAFLILGPKKLPQLARQLGGFLAQFKQMQNDFKHQLDAGVVRGQMSNSAAGAEAPNAILCSGERKSLLVVQPDPWVTEFRSAELAPTSPLTRGADVPERCATAEQVT